MYLLIGDDYVSADVGISVLQFALSILCSVQSTRTGLIWSSTQEERV